MLHRWCVRLPEVTPSIPVITWFCPFPIPPPSPAYRPVQSRATLHSLGAPSLALWATLRSGLEHQGARSQRYHKHAASKGTSEIPMVSAERICSPQRRERGITNLSAMYAGETL